MYMNFIAQTKQNQEIDLKREVSENGYKKLLSCDREQSGESFRIELKTA